MLNDAGYKFDKSGKAIPYYGNTIINFLEECDCAMFGMLEGIQNVIRQSSLADNLAFLPSESYHMTILTLCRERDRHTMFWPKGLSREASFREVDAYLKHIVDNISTPGDIVMKADRCETTKIILKPVDGRSSKALDDYRNIISGATGIRHANHENYSYHVSISYKIKPLEAKEEKEELWICKECTEMLRKQPVYFSVRKPTFVIFNDIMSYQEDLSKRGELF